MKKQSLHILKIGGKIIEDEARLNKFLRAFTRLDGPKVLVHGGAAKANSLSRQLGITPKIVDGRRITGAESLEVAIMVYAGLFNKKIVAKLQSLQCGAIGLSGADGNAIKAGKRPVKAIDFGFVGDIEAINTAFIGGLLSIGLTPVFCAITHDGSGQLLNTNSDTIAAQLAIELAPHFEVSLWFCFEKEGVLADPADDNSIISTLSQSAYRDYQKQGVISAGMLPKLDNAFNALQHGAAEVVIGSPESIWKKKWTELRLPH